MVKEQGIISRDVLEELLLDIKNSMNITKKDLVFKIFKNGILQSFLQPQISVGLLILLIRKTVGMLCIWLTTGACMVSVDYDREDRELIKSGVDVERLRG